MEDEMSTEVARASGRHAAQRARSRYIPGARETAWYLGTAMGGVGRVKARAWMVSAAVFAPTAAATWVRWH